MSNMCTNNESRRETEYVVLGRGGRVKKIKSSLEEQFINFNKRIFLLGVLETPRRNKPNNDFTVIVRFDFHTFGGDREYGRTHGINVIAAGNTL